MMRPAFAGIPEITEDNAACAEKQKRLRQA